MSYPACKTNRCHSGDHACRTPFECQHESLITATGLHRIFPLGRIYTPEVQTAPSWLERIRRLFAH